ncbi:uncharacterized protein Z519_07224 [Cladophialophora bantiana CBS 173.52]|uniref:LCCL domain-containing protein n=1 Tax=Cladophialophora bantiana (strain ATCC 10958 / CBS 173.52 / CDC B-1940 / NIH 8579) TaxID=1442370 RepID=A0A0D2HN36_CLAB1|nr:uncharacterized protein Z519_07224 [Cladophialophora bantiana CBS 173.52]KIW92240.1 hypothetical protein Z519_07224 [Cladophialophora bantiana CBS 173.52]
MSKKTFLQSSEWSTISSQLYHSESPTEDYPLRNFDEVDSARDNSSHESLLGPAEPAYDREEAGILVAPHELSDQPTSGNRVSGKRHNRSKSTLDAVLKWIKGPKTPRVYRIQSSEWLQNACDRLLHRVLPTKRLRLFALLILYIIWSGMFLWALPMSAISSIDSVDGQPIRLDCTSRLWFVSPGVVNRLQITNQYYNYRSLVIGGRPRDLGDHASPVYRGDSYICAAAIHAGIATNGRGGCGVLLRTGEQSNFPGVDVHGILSIGFPSSFPLSFTFNSSRVATPAGCRDPRWTFLGTSILITSLFSVFVTSAVTLFWSIFVGVFFHVALISDSPYFQDHADVVSMAIRRFLPAAFVGHVIYQYCVRRTLSGLKAPVERTVLWLGACWVGALNNLTFDRIPISRLTPHDLEQQPGAILALSLITAILLVIAAGQAWCFRTEGRMPRYLLFYAIVGASLVALLLVPGMNVRIHHYILALILLPGTALQTRPSLLYQGVLIGLFVNGVARWGFDSLLQTPAQLLQEGGALGSLVPRQSSAPVVVGADTITFSFGGDPAISSSSLSTLPPFDGISVLVNDVLRFQALMPDDEMTFQWTRRVAGEPEFFRFAYVKRRQSGPGYWYGDFTVPALWMGNGSWARGAS